jgi:sigma-E factor negative regulatory protein RseC
MVKCEIVEEIGIIERENGQIATVSVLKRDACEGCSLKSCGTDGKSTTIEALNPVHARVGQKVKLSIKSNNYLKSAVIVYGIPAVSLVLGAVIGREVMSAHYPMRDPEGIAALSGLTACMASFFSVKIWSRMSEKQEAPKPIIEEILESEQ